MSERKIEAASDGWGTPANIVETTENDRGHYGSGTWGRIAIGAAIFLVGVSYAKRRSR